MKNTWLFIISFVALGVVIFLAWFRYKAHSRERSLKNVAVIAHTHTIKMLPEYRAAKRRYYTLLALAGVSFIATLISFTCVAARPIGSQTRNSVNESRDIILCLDVSGSMSFYQEDLLTDFANITKEMHGERIGVTIFDSKPASLIPLSDDYVAVEDLIDDLKTNFDDYGYAVMGGVGASSMIGDGVIGCINSFPNLGEEGRSKSIIVATDNMASTATVNGQAPIDIMQAAQYGMRYDITMYGILVPTTTPISALEGKAAIEGSFMKAIMNTGGVPYNANDYTGSDRRFTSDIVQRILEQEAAKLTGAPEIIYSDTPEVMSIISLASFTLFAFLIWRLRL